MTLRRWAAGTCLVLAACQPLPHPFADDRPPASLLTVRDSAGVTIGPIAGTPRATAEKLRAAVAKELQKHDIPASATTASVASYQLNGRIQETPPAHGKAGMTVFWQLRSAAGNMVGERQTHFAAAPADWTAGAVGPVGELAAASADALAPLLSDEPLPHPLADVAKEAEGRLRVAVGGIEGAPGDGDTSLAGSMTAVLKRHDLDIVTDAKGSGTPRLDARVTLSPAPGAPGKQHIKIVWVMHRADGSQVGTVAQENDIQKGSLDGAWGDVAYTVAVAAESGILELIARSGPPPKPVSAPAPAPAAKPAAAPAAGPTPKPPPNR